MAFWLFVVHFLLEMQLSLPWILTRKRLIFSIIADGILFTFLYYTLYGWRFGVWPDLSPRLAVLLAIWSLSGYVIGRYVSGGQKSSESDAWHFFGKQLIGTGTVLLLTLGITLLHIWLFNQNPVLASFRSFLIPFLGSLAVLSPLVQFAICRLSAIRDQDGRSTWIYVGSDLGLQRLQGLMKWSRVRVRLEHVRPEHLGKSFHCQYIIDHFHSQAFDVLATLSKYQLKGSVVLNRLAWQTHCLCLAIYHDIKL